MSETHKLILDCPDGGTFEVTTPDGCGSQFIEAVRSLNGYQTQIRDPETSELINNPQSKGEFAAAYVFDVICNASAAANHKQKVAVAQAAATSENVATRDAMQFTWTPAE